ncbi:restriction endonuclease [Micromonospora sp. Llam0]|uniref:restriction endonuclease n=1 Tax=Micromonospora sp. Llam0 TaxID=2485143 RepID=UPI000F4A22B6|nr:restriction endonuclease [Micromonospora sp. Llam0]ROO60417.1 restriction endonuclease [Micromonospora sp. Llam0]
MEGRPEGAPRPQQVEDWAAAEANAVAWMKWLGHPDAHPTKPGADGGIDAIAMGAFAQVKWYGKPVGPRPLRELAGARANRPGTLYFFVNNRYTQAALAYAEQVGMAAFVYSPADGMITPVSSAARLIFQSARDGSRTGERRSHPAASPTEPPRQRQKSRTSEASATGTNQKSPPGAQPRGYSSAARQQRRGSDNPSPPVVEHVSSEYHPFQEGEMFQNLRQKRDARAGAVPAPQDASVAAEQRSPTFQSTAISRQPQPSASGCLGIGGLGALALAACGYGATDGGAWLAWLAVSGGVALTVGILSALVGAKRP